LTYLFPDENNINVAFLINKLLSHIKLKTDG
jgi:hypothetical protein